ncbi:MAG TPA: type VI secretion system protein TssA [Pirellulales bacterium]|nr:type VI secretion system protein TssA [Pirellulales bacterium]
MPYESSFGNLPSDGAKRAPGGPETPFRIAVLADFSGRQGREAPAAGDELLARKPLKVAHESLDDVIESVSPKLEYSVAGGDVAVLLEFSEFDDFQPDPVARQVDRVSDLDDEGATALMRGIMHHPQYQALESTWRGLEWLLRRVQKSDRIQVILFDITAEELAADLTASDDLNATAIHRLVVEKSAEAPDGQPWAVIVGNYAFEETTAHAELLGRMAKIAARCGAPFLAAATPIAVQEGYEVPADGREAWKALGALYEAAYAGLAVPGFLLRPPFGENYRPAESFRFEEFSGAPEGYLWGNPAFACAGLLALGYMKSGWGFEPGQTLALDNIPMHSYRDSDGEAVAVCAEGKFTSSTSQELVKRGLMPLLAVRGRDSIELACIRPLALEMNVLNGRWQGGQGGPPPTSGLPKVGVGMMSKGQTSGRAAPSREGPAFVSASPAPRARQADPEVDPELAALLAGDEVPSDDGGGESASPVEESPDEAPPPENGNADAGLDPELAALLGGDAASLEQPPADEPMPELDPELAALLGESGGGETPPSDTAPTEELDPELAALLGETPAAPATEETELDPELAALLGDTPAAEETDEHMPDPTTSGDQLDPELAALLGDQPAAEQESAAEELDPELAALLGGSAAGSDSPTAEPEPAPDNEPSPYDESPPADEPAASPPSIDETDSEMATITDDRPDLDREEDSSAPSATRSASAMAQDLDSLIQQVQEVSKYGVPGSGSPPVIDFKSLLAPISDDEPAGGGVPFDVREQLEQARKEVNPDAFAPDDPMRPEDFVKADWNGVIALTQETLRGTSKNLLVAARLLEALTKKHGFAGLRDGFHLMRLLVDICWDRLDPPLEDEDMEVRAAPFNWLDDPDRAAVFPHSIRAVPLLAADGNQFSWQQWQQSQGGGAMQELVDKVILAAPRDRCQTAVDNLSQAQQELRFLMQSLTEKMGAEAPGFTSIRPAVVDCFKLAQQILQKKGPAPSAGGADEAAETGTVSDGAGGTMVVVAKPRMSTREDIYHELATAAAALERLEPHSPVPFLVRRAVELGALPFPLLMQELIRDANVLSEMNRELGIKQRQEVSEIG